MEQTKTTQNSSTSTPAPAAAGKNDRVGSISENAHDDKSDLIKPNSLLSFVQAKLTVGAPDDPYEKEADDVADKIMRLPDQALIQEKCADCEKEPDEKIQQKRINPPPFIQKKCDECEEEQINRMPVPGNDPGLIQAKTNRDSSVNDSLSFAIQSSRGNGSPLDKDTRSFMENRFGADFSGVKVHTGSDAIQMSRELNAQAFTVGRDVYFNENKYQPQIDPGKSLIAHELTHVVQQSGDTIRKQVETPSSAVEPLIRPPRFIVDDTAIPLQGQMRRSEFLERLTVEVCATVDLALQGTEFSSDNCPYIRAVFARHQRSTPLQLEQVIARYQPLADLAQSAEDLIQQVKARVITAVTHWKQTGEIPEIQDDITTQVASALPTDAGASSGTSPEPATTSSSTEGTDIETEELHFKSKTNGAAQTHSPESVLKSLGKGDPISSSVRGKMETAFGTDFSNVEVHTDGHAAGLASDMNARAFAVGNHVAFGTGEHQPGTLIGDALMAHELAHVQQQKGAGINNKSNTNTPSDQLENDADNAAVGAVARMWGKTTDFFSTISANAMPALKTGLRLQSCGEPTRQDLIDELEVPEAPEPEAAPVEPVLPTAPVTTPGQPVEYIDLEGLEFQAVTDDDTILYLLSGQKLYVLPAKGLVQVPIRVRGQAGPQKGPFFSMPAVGHAGLHLIQTGKGTGVLFDAAGTRQGQPQVLLPASLQTLRDRYQITQITGALLSHGHADHVSSLPELIRTRQLTASQIIVHAGLENASKGPLSTVWTALRSPNFTSLGFGPGWNPTSLQTVRIGNPNSPTLHATMTIGTARFEIITLESALRQHTTAIGQGKSGSSTADAASLLTRISQANAAFDITIVGDLRGRDLLRLHDSMGTTAFNQFFQNTRVLTGLHHLGAVSTQEDVRGLQRLMEAVGASRNPITVISQTGANMNTELVRLLQMAGIRVLALPDLDPTRLRSVVASSAGPVRAQGAMEFGAEPTVSGAQQRVAHMERAATLLESLGTMPFENSGRTGSGMAAELRSEITRLTQLLSQRITDILNQAHPSTRTPGFDERVRLNNTALERLEGAEALLGRTEVQRLSRLRPQAEEMRARLEAARRSGVYNLRLRSLIAEVGPQTAKQLLIDPLGQPMSVRQQRRTRRAAEAALGRQARAMRAMTTRGSTPITGRARAAAWFGLAMELWNVVGPMIEEQIADGRRADQLDVYRFLGALIWWGEKGISPPVVGDTGGVPITDPELLSLSIQKRQYDDLPRERRTQITLPPEVNSATPLRRLYIPPPSRWADQSVVGAGQIPPDTFWDLFAIWANAHVQTYEDFAAEFLDHPNAPVRPASGSLGSRRWEMQWGAVGTDGHVTEQWEQSDRLSTIMNAAENRVRISTTNTLAEQWGRHEAVGAPRSTGPSIGPSSTSPDQSATRPTNMGRLLRGSELYNYYRNGYVKIPRSRIDEPNDLSFFVFQNDSPAKDYLLIRAADFATYMALRNLMVWRWHETIRIPRPPATIFRDPANIYFDRPEEIPLDMYISDANERRALEIVRSSQRRGNFPDGFFWKTFSMAESGMYRGELDIWVNVQNTGAFVFARREDVVVT